MNISEIGVLILCGGRGTRLQSVVSDVPKPMALIKEKPFLQWQVEYLYSFGLRKFHFLSGYKSEVIEDFFREFELEGASFKISKEDEPLGTGGAVKNFLKSSSIEDLLVLNGDTFFKLNVEKFLFDCLNLNAKNAIALNYMDDISRYGSVEVKDNKVLKFKEKKDHGNGLINSGVYLIDPVKINEFNKNKFSIEQDYFPGLIDKNELFAFEYNEYFIDIGIPEDYKRAQKEVSI